jgi:hypothetical protein
VTKPTVMIAMPTLGQVCTGTMNCLLSLIQTTSATCKLFTTEGISFIPGARNYIASIFLQSKADYLLCIDSDLVFPCGNPDMLAAYLSIPLTVLPQAVQELFAINSLDQLLAHNKLIIGADYYRKVQALRDRGKLSTVNAYEAGMQDWEGFDFYLQDRLLSCKHLASGFMLTHRSVFEFLQTSYPEIRYREGVEERWGFYNPLMVEEGYLPEDYAFCHRLREQGFELWLDPRLPLGHLGTYAYNGVSTQIQILSKVKRQPDLCVITPDWSCYEVWGEVFLTFIQQCPIAIQKVALWCDPQEANRLQVENILGDFLLQLEVDTSLNIWIDIRPSWETVRLFAEATYWYAPASIGAYQVLAQQQQTQILC